MEIGVHSRLRQNGLSNNRSDCTVEREKMTTFYLRNLRYGGFWISAGCSTVTETLGAWPVELVLPRSDPPLTDTQATTAVQDVGDQRSPRDIPVLTWPLATLSPGLPLVRLRQSALDANEAFFFCLSNAWLWWLFGMIPMPDECALSGHESYHPQWQ